jgi:hypothetical protein
MTERRRPVKRPGPFAVVVASLGTFLVVLAFLASQMAAGRDPALRPKRAAVAQEPPRRVLVRRVVQQRVIVTKVEPGEDEDEGEGDDGSARVSSASRTVVSSAPAPTPAPVAPPPTTRSS